MILEMFVAAACTAGHCSEAMSNYYIYNPLFKDKTEEIILTVSNHLDPLIKWYVAPVAGIAISKKVVFDLSENNKMYIEIRNSTVVGLSYHF